MNDRINRIVFFLCLIMIPAILYSKALITIIYILLALTAISSLIIHRRIESSRMIILLPFTLVFLATVMSGCNSSDHDQWIHHVVIKLPFFIVPIAFIAPIQVSFRQVIDFHIWLILIFAIAVVPVSIHAILHHTDMQQLIAVGQAIPTPIEHVKYSMFNAYAAISGIALLRYYSNRLAPPARILIWVCTSLLILALHFLSVRTGLLIFYVSVIYLLAYEIAKYRRLWTALRVVIGIGMLSVVSYLLMPSLQTKMAYMFYDWQMLLSGEGNHYSDSERIFSYQMALDLIKDQPIFGTGMGDLRQSSVDYYRSHDRGDYFNYPHSQWLYILSGMGMVGFSIFMLGLYIPLVYASASLFLQLLYLNYTLSFFVENSFERSISVAFFIIISNIILSASSINKKGSLYLTPK